MKALIVEDDMPSRKFLQKVLEQYGSVEYAVDGQAAMDAFTLAFQNQEPFDLVCLDIMLPKMDGQQVLKAIRKYEQEHGVSGLDGVKIIMTTALRDSKNIINAFIEQCEAYLAKPIERDALTAELRSFGLID
jgi:two-component system chemotaxis response regulator CheY